MGRSCCNVECPPGLRGPRGINGTIGPQGIPGAPAFAPSFGYIYNVLDQAVAVNAPVVFSDTGTSTPGIIHVDGTAPIIVGVPGTYLLTYSVSGTEPNQFAIFVNGNPIAESRYGSGAGSQQNNGQLILTLASSDILTLVNSSSPAAVGLPPLVGGTESAVSASVLLELLLP